MKSPRLLCLFALLAPFGCGSADQVAPPPVAGATVAAPANVTPPPTPMGAASTRHAPKAPVAIEEYFKTRRVRGLSFSFDDKLIAYMNDEGGRPDVWVRPLAGGAATQITHAEGFVHSFAFSPAEDRLAYELDKGGDELPHLFLTNAKGDSPKDIVSDIPAGRRTTFVRWADDGKTLLYESSARDEKYMDLCEYDTRTGKSKILWKSEGAFALNGVSDDHQRFVIAETRSDADNDLYLVERRSPEKRTLLTKHDGDVNTQAQSFSKDGKTLYVTSDAKGENAALYALDLATMKQTPALAMPWDVEWASTSRSGRYSFTSANVDGVPALVVTDTKTKNPIALPPAPRGGAWDAIDFTRTGPMVLGFSKSDRYLGVVLRSDTTPVSPWVLDLKEGKAIQVIDPRPESLKDRAMITGTSVKIPSFDGKEVPAFLYTPPGEGPFPAVIDVHGGPTAQSRRDFSPMRQYLLSKGYAVLVPNVRGSTGYGKTWTRLDNLDLGGGPLKDIVACKKYLVEKAHVAADKVVVMGGSYGGYMALAAATFTPDEFAAEVDYFGVSDLKTLVESFPPYWAAASTYIYKKFGDPKNPAHAAYQHDRSPIHFLDRVTKPILVVQGEKDARVKKDQSDRVVEALKARHVRVHYLVLANEGHGFTKNENYLAAYRMTDRFLDRYVWGDESVTVE